MRGVLSRLLGVGALRNVIRTCRLNLRTLGLHALILFDTLIWLNALIWLDALVCLRHTLFRGTLLLRAATVF